MTTKIKTILFTLLAVFGSVSSSLFLLSGTALAKTAAEMNNRERVVSYGYYQATSKCLENSLQATMRPQISTSDALNPQSWFVGTQGPTEMTVGRVIDASDGVRECQNLITGALNLWGYGADYSRFLIDVGYTLTGGNYTLPSNVPTNLGPAMRTAIRNRVYAGNSPTLTAPMNYILSLESFTLGCGAQALGTYSSLTQTAGGAADINARLNSSDGKHYRVNLVDTTTNPTTFQDTVFSITANGDTQVGLYEDNSNPADITATCRELAQRVTANAGAFRTYYDALTPEQQTDVGNGGSATAPPPEDGGSSCVITGIGWIVCPVATFLSWVTDAAYAAVEQLMIVQPVSLTDFSAENAIYTIWASIRGLANVLFIFAFFMIVLSQATSIGISSYGIKKLLPRLIVAAILVNLSYFLCALAVDISNIVGAGIDGIITSAYNDSDAEPTQNQTWSGLTYMALSGVGIFAGGSALLTSAGGLLAGGGSLAGAAWAMLLPFLVTALLAVVTGLTVLVLRQALIILLIIISPLAFAAYILPNTDGLFSKWRKAFMAMMIFYPLVAIIFSGSKVAAQIMRTTAPDQAVLHELVRVASLGVQFFPLVALPFIMKFSGGVLSRVAGVINNPNKGPFDRLRKKAQANRDYRVGLARDRAATALKKPKDIGAENSEFDKKFRTTRGGRVVHRGFKGWTSRGFANQIERDEIHKATQRRMQENIEEAVYSGMAPQQNASGLAVDQRLASRMAGHTRKDYTDQVALGKANLDAEQVRKNLAAAEGRAEKAKKAVDEARAAVKTDRDQDMQKVLADLVSRQGAVFRDAMKDADAARQRKEMAVLRGEAVNPSDEAAITRAAGMQQALQEQAKRTVHLNGIDYERRHGLWEKLQEETDASAALPAAQSAAASKEATVSNAMEAVGATKLNEINKVLARGQAVVDKIETEDLKSSMLMQQNMRVSGGDHKKIMSQGVGTTVQTANGQSITVTEAMQAASAATMISQGRELDTVTNLVAKLQDPALRSFAVGQMRSSYDKLKQKQVALTDEGFQARIMQGDFSGTSDPTGKLFRQAYDEATRSKASTLNNNNYASQDRASAEAIARILQGSATNTSGQTLSFDDQTRRTMLEFSHTALNVPTVRQFMPATAVDVHQQIDRMYTPSRTSTNGS